MAALRVRQLATPLDVVAATGAWTTVAVLGGWSPPANTHAPADWSSALNAATSWYAFCAASGGGGALPSTECTLSMYCFIEGPFLTGPAACRPVRLPRASGASSLASYAGPAAAAGAPARAG